MYVHALAGCTAASLSEMSLFTLCLIAYASPNDTDPAGTHWRLLWIDINFTQMWPQRATEAWVDECTQSHISIRKTTVWARAWYFIIAMTLLPLPLRWHSIQDWNVTSSCYLHGDYNTHMFGTVSVHYVHFLLHKYSACMDLTALDQPASQTVVINVWNVTGSQFYTLLCDQTNPFYGQCVSI